MLHLKSFPAFSRSNRSLISSQLSYVMAGYRYFVCPVEFNNDSNSFQVDCEPSELFQLQEYVLPSLLESATGWVRSRWFLRFILSATSSEASNESLRLV